VFTTVSEPVPNNPPNQPTDPVPDNGTTGVIVDSDVSWICSDPDGDDVTYDVYFGTTSTLLKMSSNQTGTSYDPGTMSLGTTYYWRIVAWDIYDAVTVGPLWHFTTESLVYYELEPIDDSFTSSFRNRKHGKAKILLAGDIKLDKIVIHNYIWLKFDLNDLQGISITSAKLYLQSFICSGYQPGYKNIFKSCNGLIHRYSKIPSNAYYDQVFGAHFSSNDNWVENKIRWKNQPSFNPVPEDTITNPESFSTIEFDLTNIVQSEINGDGYISIVIKSEDNSNYNLFSMFSKENLEFLRPILQIN
jgi:hypothetical protein